jgi:PEP-CTERM motif
MCFLIFLLEEYVMKKLFLLMLVLSVACSASAAIVELSDADLLAFTVSGGEDGSLDLITDIPGDPGVQYDVSFAAGAGWKDVALTRYSAVVPLGDTWTVKIKNVSADGKYVALYPFMQVDGWVYNQGSGVNLAYGAETILTMVNPATSSTESVGIKVATDNWMNRVDAGSASIQVIPIVPEPATMVLLGLGGLILRRKRS